MMRRPRWLGPLTVALEPLPPLFHRLNREHFEGSLVQAGLPLVAVRWSDGRLTRTAGIYRRGRRRDGSDVCEIVLSRPVLEPLPRQATLSTLCHEMIHAWVDRVLHHGRIEHVISVRGAVEQCPQLLGPGGIGWAAWCRC